MHAIATPTTSLSLLVPVSLLPSEGDELPSDVLTKPVTGIASLFEVHRSIAVPRAAHFVLKDGDVTFDGCIESESALLLLHMFSDEDKMPQLETRAAMSQFNWAGVLSDVAEATQSEHFLGTPEELARVFSEAVSEAALSTVAGFAGEPVPLLTVKLDAEERSATISFLGLWLADAVGMDELRRSLPGLSWLDGSAVGQTSCILLDAAEVEGRGLKEALASAAMLAMVLGGPVARAGDVKTVASSSRLSSFFGMDSRPGEVLKVKSQKLAQDAPRIYRNVMEQTEFCDIRVIVDIGGQRAYIVKDGQVAFETPISSAAKGHRTPRGTFTITEKVRSGKMSTIYKCPLPGWMRLGETAIGMHQGDLPGYPASHGCIRMPIESALYIFDHAPKGTTVEVVDSWKPDAVVKPELVATR